MHPCNTCTKDEKNVHKVFPKAYIDVRRHMLASFSTFVLGHLMHGSLHDIREKRLYLWTVQAIINHYWIVLTSFLG